MWALRSYNKAKYRTSFNQHGCHTEEHTNTHTHTLHQQVDRNTHGKNNVTAKTWFWWFHGDRRAMIWETKEQPKKWSLICDLCKRSAFLFISVEAESYLSDKSISGKIETFCCLGHHASAVIWKSISSLKPFLSHWKQNSTIIWSDTPGIFLGN